MLVNKDTVLLLKAVESSEEKNKYEAILSDNGYLVHNVNTLQFEYINLKELANYLTRPFDYSGIVFTSPRCVNAVSIALKNTPLDSQWNGLLNFVVGEKTHDTALKTLNLNCAGKDAGNANNLADAMLENVEYFKKPLLFPHGNLKSDTLANKLLGKIALHEVLTYKTIPSSNLKKEFQEATKNFQSLPEYIIFFSPSGVSASYDIMKENIDTTDIKMIAIGPTTETAMKDKRFIVFNTLNKPTPTDLLNSLRNC